MLGTIIGGLLSEAFWMALNFDVSELNQTTAITAGKRNILRIGLSIGHACLFLLPAIIYLYITKKSLSNVSSYFNSDTFSIKKVILWGSIIFFSYPLIVQLTLLNQSIPIPEQLLIGQENSFVLLTHTLTMEGIGEMLLI